MNNKIYQLVQGEDGNYFTWGFFTNPMEAFDKLASLDDHFPFFKKYDRWPCYEIIEHEMGFGGENDNSVLFVRWHNQDGKWCPDQEYMGWHQFDMFMIFKTIDEQSRIRNFAKKFIK